MSADRPVSERNRRVHVRTRLSLARLASFRLVFGFASLLGLPLLFGLELPPGLASLALGLHLFDDPRLATAVPESDAGALLAALRDEFDSLFLQEGRQLLDYGDAPGIH